MYAMLSFLKETRFEMCLLRGVPHCFESCSENYIRGLCNTLTSVFAVNENLAQSENGIFVICLSLSMCSELGRKMCTSAALDVKNAVKQVVVASPGAVLTVTSCFKGQCCK